MEPDTLWSRFEDQLSRHAPSWLHSFRPPALPGHLAACAAKMGVHLPDDVRHAYLRHDGCQHPQPLSAEARPLGLFGQFQWLSLDEAVSCHDELGPFHDEDQPYFEPEDQWAGAAVRPWDDVPPAWVPIARGHAHLLLVDLVPGPAGRVGQIVGRNHGHADNSCWLAAHSLSGWLVALADGLAAGTLRPALVNEGFSTDWVNVVTGEPFRMPEHAHAFGFR